MKLGLKALLSAALVFSFYSSPVLAAGDVAELEAEGVAIWKILPRESEMIRHPGAESYEFYGTQAKSKTVSAGEIAGGEATQIKIGGKGADPWSVGANVPTQLATKEGDVLVAVIYARAKTLPKEQTSTTMPIHIQEQGGKYEQFGSARAKLTEDWGRYVVYGMLDRDFKKGAVGAALHLATGKQTIELGPVYLMNMGSGAFDPEKMPESGIIR